MSEQTPQNTPPSEASPSETSVTWENSPIAKIYNPDGTPTQNAANALAEMGREDIAGHALRNGQDLFTALKTGKDAAAFASSKQEGMVKIPGEDATPEDRAAFNKSLGALESKEDYLSKIWPDNLPDDFQKDEGLAGILAEHAASSPVLNAASAQDLVGKVVAYQAEQMEALDKQAFEASEKAALEVADTLTAELGGKPQFEQFSNDAKDLLTSKEFQDLGFQFSRDEGGKLRTENPQHAAMLADPAILRMLKMVSDFKKPAGVPAGNAQPRSSDAEANRKEAAEMARKNPNGFKSQEDLNKYNQLLGIS